VPLKRINYRSCIALEALEAILEAIDRTDEMKTSARNAKILMKLESFHSKHPKPPKRRKIVCLSLINLNIRVMSFQRKRTLSPSQRK
jgi:hypothetical protein